MLATIQPSAQQANTKEQPLKTGRPAGGLSAKSKQRPKAVASQRAAVRILKLRQAVPMTQRQLANKAGLAVSNLQRIERDHGASGPSVNTLEKVAQALGVPVSDLVR